MPDKCICCGEIIPEGRQVCPNCLVSGTRESTIVKVETCFYDKEEIFENCTVQVLTNTVTGDVSIGWWKNEDREDDSV
jgi:hypothetical protein